MARGIFSLKRNSLFITLFLRGFPCNSYEKFSNWVPLAQHWHIPRHGWRYIVFSLVVVIYLALPTVFNMAKQAQTKLIDVKMALARSKELVENLALSKLFARS